MNDNEKRDLIIIGGGAGGLVVASVASQLGLKVTLIEKQEKLGGDWLHTGCVPSKSLIHVAKVVSLMRRGAEFGLDPVEPTIDLGKVQDHIQSVIDQIQPNDDPERFRAYGCEVLFGEARFTGTHTVQINDQEISAKRFVIASGSSPAIPPIEGLEAAGYLTNESLFSLRELPRRLLVLGGGPIGLEMAQAFSRLGSKVTIVEQLPQLLVHEDTEVADTLRGLLEAEGIAIHTSTRVEGVRAEGGTRMVTTNGEQVFEVDQILVAAGRKPNTQALNLEACGVNASRAGVEIDSRMRTSRKHIFACGDVCGPYPFTHMAEYQAGIVISNAIFRFPKKADYRVVPWVTYTDPELARVGITEQQALDQGLDVSVLQFPFKDIDRALAEVEPVGFTKYVIHKGRIVGATILGPRAGELIHEAVLAMKNNIKISKISNTVHVYPTLSQVHRRTVNAHLSKALFSPKTRNIVRWINRLLP